MSQILRGIARVDKRTKNLVKRLRRGDIAIIDHRDVDAVSAEALAAKGAKAVVNAQESISGRYPNRGPAILLEHGIPILDNVGVDVLQVVREGSWVEVDLADASIRRNGAVYGHGVVLTSAMVEQRTADAKSHLHFELSQFVENTLQYVRQEEHVLFEPSSVPDLKTRIAGRHALVVVRGETYREDLRAIHSYILDVRPVLIGVDGGADALVELGLRPDVILGDMDSVSDEALRSGAELVVHASNHRGAPGAARVRQMGLTAMTFEATGTSEDAALLLAFEKGADLIVAVGTHSTLVDFLDKGRSGMASTFLTRLKVGNRFVDARGVSRLYYRRLRSRDILLLIFAGFISALIVAMSSAPARAFLALLGRMIALQLRHVIPWH